MNNYKPIDKSKIERILVRGANWVGDAVMTLPALEAIRANFPKSEITVLARPWVIPLMENNPAVDTILPYSKREGFFSNLSDILKMAGEIRRLDFDLAILLQNAFEAAFLSYLGGIKHRIGYDTDHRRLLLTHAIGKNEQISEKHQVDYYLDILRAMGWEAASKEPQLHVKEEDRARAKEILKTKDIEADAPIVGLSPGAIYGPAKRWPAERFATIGDWAAERWGAKVLIMGSGGEKDICDSVAKTMGHRALDLSGGTTLGEAMGLIERCSAFVTNDSGLMHVAAALDVPMVAIFGSTNPKATGPRSKNAKVVMRDTDCAPCLRPECERDYQCMLAIEPEEVWGEMEGLNIDY